MILHHYYSDENDFAERSIKNNGIYLNNIVNFNDPLEPYAIFHKFKNENNEILSLEKPEIIDLKTINIGAFCMTTDCKNFLMWSHYANKHRGLCIGYKMPKINDDRFKIYNLKANVSDSPNANFYSESDCQLHYSKVIYKYESNNIWYNDKTKLYGSLLNDVISRKSKKWKNEKEYRVYAIDYYDKYIHSNNQFITRIIFGKYFHRCKKEQILSVLQGKNIKPKLFDADIDFKTGEIILKNFF